MAIVYRNTTLVVLNVSDFKKAVEWYRTRLGFELDYGVEEMGWGEVKTNVPGFTLGLQQSEDAGKLGAGSANVTLSVVDIAAARAELEAKGVQFDGPTDEIPGMVKLAGFRDPDGNRLMLAESLQG